MCWMSSGIDWVRIGTGSRTEPVAVDARADAKAPLEGTPGHVTAAETAGESHTLDGVVLGAQATPGFFHAQRLDERRGGGSKGASEAAAEVPWPQFCPGG
jgi:hypothetical protein